MPKKPQLNNITHKGRVAAVIANTISNQKPPPQDSSVLSAIQRSKYGLRAASERTSSKRFDFVYDTSKAAATTSPKIEVKNVGDNFIFVCDDKDQEEEREGGIAENNDVLASPPPQMNNANLPQQKVQSSKQLVDGQDNGHYQRSGKALAGTEGFVDILLHNLRCR